MVEEAAAPAGAVGRSWRRADAEAKVLGTFRYTADAAVPPCLHLGIHRATRPLARIAAVDPLSALRTKGVVAVFTGEQLHDRLGDAVFTGPAFSDQPPLAVDRVRYVGEPVAAVVARDLATARSAADQVVVDYEDLTPVLDLDGALSGDRFVHDWLRPSSVFGDLKHLSGRRGTNINYQYDLRHGDASAALDSAAHFVTASFWSPPTHHVPIELPCTTAWVEGDRLEMVTTTQTPSYVRHALAAMLGLQLNQVRVRTYGLGGSFGSKMYDRFEPLVGAVAWLLRRPVRFEATREDAFLVTTRHGTAVTGQMGCDDDGRLVAATADVRYDTGAYADVGPRIAAKSGMVACGPYRLDHVSITSRCIYTDKPSAGPFRGFGVPQVAWAHESLVDELARIRGEDPAEFRRRNLLREGDVAPVGTVMHSADCIGCLDAVTAAVGWDDSLPRNYDSWRYGKGVAVGIKAVLTPTVANAVLQMNQDGSATLLISTVDMGQGSDTIMSQIAAEVLHLGQGKVRVVNPDTDVTPYDTITAGSRSTYHTGNAVRKAATSMAERLVAAAARQMGVATSDCKLTAEGVLSTTSQRTLSIPEIMQTETGAVGTTMTAEATFTTEWVPYDKETGRSLQVTEHWFAGASAVVLAVDTRTGRIRIEHLAVAGDVGRAINPALVKQQLVGAAIMGIGHALFDELVFDGGQMLNGTLVDYQLPSVRDLPGKITTIIVENPHRGGPFGAKGVGETAIIPLAPAIANAVRDAVGVRITTLPLTPERISASLSGQGSLP